MNWKLTLFVSSVLALVIALGFSLSVGHRMENSGGTAPAEGSFDRVIRTGTMRAGFVSYPPGSIVDPKTKEVSGIFPDLLGRIGKNTGLNVEFTEEVGWANLIEGLETRRFDIIGGVWANPNRGKMATISEPAFFSGVGVWVREGETRISSDGNWASINTPEVRIGAIDGSTPLNIAKAQFPNAKLVTYPNLVTEPQLFVDLATNKIDVFFAEPAQGLLYQQANPGKVKNLAQDRPIRVFGHVFLMRRGEPQFKIFIDTALADLESSGVVDEFLRKYEPAPGAFYPRAPRHLSPARPEPGL